MRRYDELRDGGRRARRRKGKPEAASADGGRSGRSHPLILIHTDAQRKERREGDGRTTDADGGGGSA